MKSTLLEELGNRGIALLGLGVENQALARFFLSRGIGFSVCDRGSAESFAALPQEWGDEVAHWHLGEDYLARLAEFEPKVKTGYLKRYAEKVGSASTGAVFTL